jgi:hypothetical protein
MIRQASISDVRDVCMGIVLTGASRPLFAAVLNVRLIENMNEAGKPARKGGYGIMCFLLMCVKWHRCSKITDIQFDISD